MRKIVHLIINRVTLSRLKDLLLFGFDNLSIFNFMAKTRVLYISQEIKPYLPESPISLFGHNLPQYMHEHGYEVRIFMPNYGSVNERRNQLHEVIRLSGLNIVIDENDHPLIIKVASMQPSRIQVYFIDNDDYFQKESSDIDAVGSNRSDNDERAIFFAHGTAETIKKLRWEPAVIHSSGWITSVSPLYLRNLIGSDPAYANTKLVYSVLPGEIQATLDPQMGRKLQEMGFDSKEVAPLNVETPDTNTLHKLAISCSDGVVFHTDQPAPELLEFVKSKNIPYLTKEQIEDMAAYDEFYKSL